MHGMKSMPHKLLRSNTKVAYTGIITAYEVFCRFSQLNTLPLVPPPLLPPRPCPGWPSKSSHRSDRLPYSFPPPHFSPACCEARMCEGEKGDEE